MDKYLLEILKESNTIIIPGLGALTITNKDTGETMFMPYLQHDDGKLAEFISEKDGMDLADAKNMVAKYVREIQSELDKGESYSMFGLGEFVKADDGDIEFSHTANSELAQQTKEEPVVIAPIVAASDEVIETEVEETVEEIAEEVEVENTVEETVESAVEELNVENTVEETVESAVEELNVENTVEETVESAVEELNVENTVEETVESAVEELNVENTVEETVESAVEELNVENTVEETVESAVEELNVENTVEETVESAVEELNVENTVEETVDSAVEELNVENTVEETVEGAVEELNVENTVEETVESAVEELNVENTVEDTVESAVEEIEVPAVPEISDEISAASEILPESSLEIENPIVDEPIAAVEPENIEISEEELEIRHTIEEAFGKTPEPSPEAVVTPKSSKKVVVPDVPLQPAAAMGGLIADEPHVDEIPEEEVKEEKEKPSARFWVMMILIAIIIIGGGAYIGRNYNELKQHISFLADDELEEEDLISDDYKNQKLKSANDKSNLDDSKKGKTDTETSFDPDKVEKPANVEKPKADEKPKVIEKPKVVEKPKITPTPSSGGHYHIIAGAFSSVENANRLVDEYKKRGLSGASVVKNGELHAVSMQSYATSAQANADLNKMNAISNGAWILYK